MNPPAAAPNKKAHTYQENQRPRNDSSVTPIAATAVRAASGGIAITIPAQSHAKVAQLSTKYRGTSLVSDDVGMVGGYMQLAFIPALIMVCQFNGGKLQLIASIAWSICSTLEKPMIAEWIWE
jgi:hypothetical protein